MRMNLFFNEPCKAMLHFGENMKFKYFYKVMIGKKLTLGFVIGEEIIGKE